MILDEHKVASFYAQADIFVTASASETFGFTVAEAMACGTPAVVVKSGAFPKVYNMISEHMFEVEDIQAYCECCIQMFGNLDQKSIEAREIVVNGFSIQSSIQDLLETYRWILDGCPDRG
jgi:glycosyltransferase involved in cell wall biosynthesis